MDANSEQARVIAALVGSTPEKVSEPFGFAKEVSYPKLPNKCHFVQKFTEEKQPYLVFYHGRGCHTGREGDDRRPTLHVSAEGLITVECVSLRRKPMTLVELIADLKKQLASRRMTLPKYVESLHACCTDARLALLAQEGQQAA